MPVWDERQFNNSLSKETVEPVYLLYGEEVFLLDQAIQGLRDKSLGDGLRDFNLDVFYGRDGDMSRIKDVVETLPMMTQNRVVILKEAQDLKDKDWEALWPVVQNPVDSTVFIIVASKVDKRKKYYKTLMKSGVVVEFRKPFENQIPAWIKYIGQKHGLVVGDAQAQLVQQMAGSGLLSIDGEMRKLSQYLGERTTVEVEDIHRVVSRARIDSVFDLTDAIGGKDRATALECLANLLEHGQNEVGALALIIRHVRILALIQQGQSEGLGGAKLSQRAGVPNFFLKKYVEQSRKWTGTKIQATYGALLDTDRALKSSPVSSHIWLENLVIRTCAP